MIQDQALWEQCVAFHGHVCGGLILGYQAVMMARQQLEAQGRALDEELVCVAEHDACGVDAVQVILGCTVGKGNLLFRVTGKQAYAFYDREGGQAFRIVKRPGLAAVKREEAFEYFSALAPEEIYEVKEARPLPERAKRFQSMPCHVCGEEVGEYWLHIQEGQPTCRDCKDRYERFSI